MPAPKKSKKKTRHDPTGAMSRPKAAQQAANQSPDQLLQQLNNGSPTQQILACGALAHLLGGDKSSEKMCRALAQKGGVKRLLVMLCLPNVDVAIAAATALRNLSAVGVSASQAIVKEDGLTAVLGVLSDRTQTGPAQRQKLLEQVLALLTTISSNLDVAVKRFTSSQQNGVLSCVLTSMGADVSPPLLLQAAQFLCVVTEENPALCTVLRNSEAMTVLSRVCGQHASSPSAAVFAAGTLVNIMTSDPTIVTAVLPLVMKTLATIISQEPVALCGPLLASLGPARERFEAQFKAIGERAAAAKAQGGNVDTSQDASLLDHWDQTAGEALRCWHDSVASCRHALEILTNLCASEQEETGTPNPASVDVSSQVQQMVLKGGLLAHMSARMGSGLALGGLDGISACQGALIKMGLGAASNQQSEVVRMADALSQVRHTASSCVSNVVLHFPTKALGDLDGLFHHTCTILAPAAASILQENKRQQQIKHSKASPTSPPQGETAGVAAAAADGAVALAQTEAESLTGMAWGIVRAAPSVMPTKQELQLLLALARCSSAEGDIQLHLAGLLGCLGCAQQHFHLNFIIGTVLLGLSESPHCALDAKIEAVNSLIDVYSEDNVHTKSIQQIQLLQKLAALGRFFVEQRGVVEADPLLAGRLGETLTNLSAFLAYKKDHV